MRLIDGRLQHILDTGDIFQSLLRDFLAREKPQEVSSQSAGELRAYFAAAVRYKINTKARKERRRAGSLSAEETPISSESPVPQQLEDQDFLDAVRARLPNHQRLLLELRNDGLTWPEIGEQVGGNPDALRIGLTRAVAAVLSQLEPEESRGGL
jgi:DNA-directed RNA polymerase specialized sigma24 family protein